MLTYVDLTPSMWEGDALPVSAFQAPRLRSYQPREHSGHLREHHVVFLYVHCLKFIVSAFETKKEIVTNAVLKTGIPFYLKGKMVLSEYN